jgi:hypothetical protein
MKITNLKDAFPHGALLAAALLAGAPAARAELEMLPKRVVTAIDFGQIKDGTLKGFDAEDQSLTRTGVYLTTAGIRDERLTVRMTIGGLFWYPLPEQNTPGTRIVRFGPGVGEAQAIYAFGDPQNPSARLQFGLFPNKYNPDAANLGEYLYRSGTYPGYLVTGGWSYLNSASYMAQGVKLHLPMLGGKLKHELTLFMERDYQPTHNLTPGYLATYQATPFLSIGAGAVWSHGLPLKRSTIVTPKTRINAYDKDTEEPLTLSDRAKPGYTYYGPGDPRNDTRVRENGDPAIGTIDPVTGDFIVGVTENGTPRNDLGYYTFKGFKTMGMASVDVGSLLGNESIRPGEFKVYSEIALLGVANQPFYYENRSERMPIMFGVRLPTFGLLDRLSIEAEYLKSRFANTIALPYDKQIPLPLNAESEDPFHYSDSAVAANPADFEKDDWKWSLYASRAVAEGVTIYAQVASDHLRHFDDEVKTQDRPGTIRTKDWYYLFRVEFGLF